MFYSDRELLRLLPRVLRARDFHLYLENGKRLTDLWLAGGRAVLGHKPPMVLGELKNAAERGLFTSLPHPMERRFLKALGELFPGRVFRLYADAGSLRSALADSDIPLPANRLLPDPAFPDGIADGNTEGNTDSNTDGKPDTGGFSSVGGAKGKKLSLWRPFIEQSTDNISSDNMPDGSQMGAPVLAPVLPWPLGPDALVLQKNMDASFPTGEIIPPVLLAPATRALYDLLAVIKDGDRVRRVYPKVEKALKGSPWRRRGIYLTIEADRENYAALFRRFLEGGFLIPPSPVEPLILPASISDGEEAKLAGLLKL